MGESEQRQRVIRASEIGQYAYCAQAWWLGSIQGLPSSAGREMTAGQVVHRRHGREVSASLWLSRVAYTTLLLATVAGVVWMVSWVVG